MEHTEAEYWSHTDRSGGPDACWRWQLSCTADGAGRFHFHGKIRLTHNIAFFLAHDGVWPQKFDVLPCAALKSCCNPAHLQKRNVLVSHKTLTRSLQRVMLQSGRQLAFLQVLSRIYPQLGQLNALLGPKLADVLDVFEGQTIILPSRAELLELARAVDCFLTLRDTHLRNAANASKKLQSRYQCSAADITTYANLGATLLLNTQDCKNYETR
jgi:hypothetical protein